MAIKNLEHSTNEVIGWRRYLHENPELSFKEYKTSQFVYETLLSFGGLEVSRPTETSVMARIIGQRPGRVLAIRADMDALPIYEENTFEFISRTPGVMHACGHDGHTAMLLGTAKILCGMKEQIKGEIRFLFQHAEEQHPGGAEEMVQAGVMEGVDLVIGAHLMSTLEIGKIGIAYGPMMAARDIFSITIKGSGGHGANPHETIDPIVIASQVVGNLQQIVSRNTDPLKNLVISITSIHGGNNFNVIPSTVELRGSVRCFDVDLRESIPNKMEQIIRGITKAHGASYELNYEFGYRPVVNDLEITHVVEETVREVFGEESLIVLGPNMGSEDFSAFQQKAPGTYFNIGARNPDKGSDFPHHHPRFTVDEDALEIGIKMFINAALKLLEGER
ncbi:M20 family metallopeptidase [Fodinisporobacter ferrooxydans]|uniref:M20 family metallopeptidase n=1 Tax=Fodinisporobacter ferrooxydans TaxID=2901836 RepID=A0ABY4CH12_9BACL|nr:M20 family metallopeptidase [Alicyclobacillaceae bacterium MYW30-H2]